jgi:SAM-dependent methyltransferase
VRQADVTDLPFDDATFTLMFSQHVQMNVADKARLYEEARRGLADGGRLAIWDIVAGEDREPDFPLPWADRPEYSHLTTPGRLRTAIATSGFEIEQWNDLTDEAADLPALPGDGRADRAAVPAQPGRLGQPAAGRGHRDPGTRARPGAARRGGGRGGRRLGLAAPPNTACGLHRPAAAC